MPSQFAKYKQLFEAKALSKKFYCYGLFRQISHEYQEICPSSKYLIVASCHESRAQICKCHYLVVLGYESCISENVNSIDFAGSGKLSSVWIIMMVH